MKNLLLMKSSKRLAITTLMLLSINAFAGDHVTMYGSNFHQTGSTSMSIDLYIVNDGTTSLQLNSLNYGLNMDAPVLNGGTPSWIFMAGTSDLPTSITNRFSYGYNQDGHQLRLSSSPGSVTSVTAPSMPTGAPVHIGTFTITNSSKWASNSSGPITFQTVIAPKLTNTGVVIYSSGTSIAKSLNITGVNRDIGNPTVLSTNSISAAAAWNLEAYPNPAHNKVYVKFNSDKSENYLLQVFDLAGRVVQTKSNNAQKGNNLVDIDITNFAPGEYTLSFLAEDGSKQETKIVVN